MIKLFSIIFILFLANADVSAEPELALKDMAGKTHHLSDYKGKWLIVNYWATWCIPCQQEVPDLVALYDKRKDKDLMILGVVFEYKDTKEVTKFVDDMLVSYPIVLGNEKITNQIGSAEVLPTTYIFNPEGKLVKTRHGLITKAYIEKLVSQH